MSVTNPKPPHPSGAARLGGVALLLGSVQFVFGMAITQVGWTTPYSLLSNYISDLGAVSCGDFPVGSAHYVCSPWHSVFDTSIILLGLLTIAAAYWLRRVTPAGSLTTVGLFLLGVSGVGAIGVGLSPEDVNLTIHTVSALLAFAGGNSALIVLGWAMGRDLRWGPTYGALGILPGIIGGIALVLFATHHYLGLQVGGMERLIVAPVLLWAVFIGLKAVRMGLGERGFIIASPLGPPS